MARKPQIRHRGPPDPNLPYTSDTPDGVELLIPQRRRVRVADLDPEHYREMLIDIRELAEIGATQADIGRRLGLSQEAVAVLRNRDPNVAAALDAGNAVANKRVQEALYQRAIGYTAQVERVFQQDGQVVRATVTEHVPGDVRAQELWLCNRDPDHWRRTGHVEGLIPVDAGNTDPRRIAMAVLQALREAHQAQQAMLTPASPIDVSGATDVTDDDPR